ncbi:Light-harvesting complex-like protein OHP2, chloroplastic [Linum grandiflorum]
MSVASSFPCVNLRKPSPSSSSSASPSTSGTATYSTSVAFRPYYHHGVIIRASQPEGPIRRPVAPPLRQPLKPVVPPSPPPSSSTPPPPPPPTPKISAAQVGIVGDKGVVTLEFQRQKAKELQQYFKQKKVEEANQGPFFGFISKNEISNGRWAMFGFAVGLLTEYATGSDFVVQVKILFSNFGILDLD